MLRFAVGPTERERIASVGAVKLRHVTRLGPSNGGNDESIYESDTIGRDGDGLWDGRERR